MAYDLSGLKMRKAIALGAIVLACLTVEADNSMCGGESSEFDIGKAMDSLFGNVGQAKGQGATASEDNTPGGRQEDASDEGDGQRAAQGESDMEKLRRLIGGLNRGKTPKQAVQKDQRAPKVEGAVCQTCKGRKKVRREVACPKCEGSGKIISPAKRLIHGWSQPRASVCRNCKGRGKVRATVDCPACQ